MRGAWVLVLPGLLGGCLPPAVAVASYAVDGASYVASGKSLSDHGISTVADKDCATWHFFVGRAVCEDPRHPTPKAPLEVHGNSRVVQAVASQVPAVVPAVATMDGGRHYLVVGSFADRDKAERVARTYAGFHPQLVAVTLGGRALSRVVVGPLDDAQEADLRGRGPAYAVQAPHSKLLMRAAAD